MICQRENEGWIGFRAWLTWKDKLVTWNSCVRGRKLARVRAISRFFGASGVLELDSKGEAVTARAGSMSLSVHKHWRMALKVRWPGAAVEHDTPNPASVLILNYPSRYL